MPTKEELDSLLAWEFPQEKALIYLNHAGVAPWPRRAAEAVTRFAQENTRMGGRRYPAWVELEQRLREQLARLINAPSAADIALLKSTSEGLSFVAGGLNWHPGDNIVTAAGEFPSNRLPWEALRGRSVELREISLDGDTVEDPEQALLEACDERTRLLTISAVQYADGLRLDLPRLGSGCRRRGVLFCVDAIQWLGAHPFDVQLCGADFVAADGHKWMLGPEGLALFYCAAARRPDLELLEYGWHMLEEPGAYEQRTTRAADDARRFECGSPNLLAAHALSASLSLLEEIGIREVSRRIRTLTAWLRTAVRERGWELLGPSTPERCLGIVTFRPRGTADPGGLQRALLERDVICAARGGGLRFSPHCYTSREQLAEALERLESLCS